MLGHRISSLRLSRGMSQTELAKRLNVSASAVGMYEQGRREPSVEILIALSQEFGVSLDYLLAGKPDTVRDISALHQLLDTSSGTGGGTSTNFASKEELVCHLLWALLE